MRILFATTTLPFPVTNGAAMRSASILAALKELGHEVELIGFGSGEQEVHPDARRLCRTVRAVAHVVKSQTATVDYWRRLWVLASPLPYGANLCRSSMMREAIGEALRRGGVDAVVCDTLDSMVNLPEHCEVPLVLNSQNVENLIIRRFAERERNPVRRAYASIEASKLFRWERQACCRAGVVLVCSEVDRRTLHSMCPAARFEIVPNVVDTHTYVSENWDDGRTLLFSGGMDWYPNRDAVEFFVFSVLPEIRRQAPGVRFVVAGRNPSPDFLKRFEGIPGIEFTGTVPDIRAEIARATVCVIPLRIGSGTRMKILEAGAMGKAMVSTRLGAEGLDFEDSREITLEDEPGAFADAVVQLLGDPNRRRHMGTLARTRVENSYSLAVLKTSLEKMLNGLRPPPVEFDL